MRTQADGGAIRRLREEIGISLLDLAKLSDVSHAHICRLENEERHGSHAIRARVARALGVKITDISKPVARPLKQAA